MTSWEGEQKCSEKYYQVWQYFQKLSFSFGYKRALKLHDEVSLDEPLP